MDNPDNQFESPARAIAHYCARALALLFLVVGVPAALLFLAPAALKLMAGPLDPGLEKPPAPADNFSLTFLDADGKTIGRQGPVTGLSLGLSEMPPYLPAAFLAMEDRRFFQHSGIDLLGLTRAAYANWEAGRVVAGGSSISQQTVKLLSGDKERTFSRKFRELLNTASLERRFSKQQILEIYLNHIYLGESAYGVDAAARGYFGVSARQASLAQVAMLAALTRAPSIFSPRRDPVTAQARSARVLDAMVETGAISRAAAADAKAHPAALIAAKRDDHDYVLDAAAIEAKERLAESGIASGAFLVHTTIRSGLQRQAQAIVGATVRGQGRPLGFSQGAVAVMTRDGAVTAMVGGVDYAASKFNRVTQARRQPGSAFKPFVYTAALERGISMWDWRNAGPVNISGYQPINYHNASYGRLRLIDALARSVNTMTVNLAQEIGVGTVAATARRLGITSSLHPYPSLALGTEVVTPLELTAAYGAFATGTRVKPYLVARLENAFDGAVAWRHEVSQEPSVLSDGTRRDITAMLYAVVQRGTGTGARLGEREAAGKTGTSQEYRDAWFVGFTADHVAGVWLGNDDNSPMRGVTGGRVPAQVWRQVMAAAEAGTPAKKLDRTEMEPMEFLPPDVPYYEDMSPYPVQEAVSQPVRYADLRETPRWRDEPEPSSTWPAPANSVLLPSGARYERAPSYTPPADRAMLPNGARYEREASSYPAPAPIEPRYVPMPAPPPVPAMSYQDYLDRTPGPPPPDYRYGQAYPYQSYQGYQTYQPR